MILKKFKNSRRINMQEEPTNQVNDYSIEDFQIDCYAFNEIAEKHSLTSLKDITLQYELIAEETQEIKDKGIDFNDPTEVLDGVLDVMVTALGLLQKLEYLGINVNKAMQDTAYNNLSKFPYSEDIAISTAQHYETKGVKVKVEYNSSYDLFVIKNESDKVMKPTGFESNNLANCIPLNLLMDGFKYD
jgi:hypothetical protein